MMTNNDTQGDGYNDDILQFAGNTLFSGGSLLILFIALIAIVILFSTLGNDVSNTYSIQQSDDTKTTNLFLIMFVAILLIIAIMGGIRYFFGTSIYASVNNLFASDPEIDIVIDHKTVPEPDGDDEQTDDEEDPSRSTGTIPQEQVFNIPGNYYGYETAKNMCTAYGARLASYDEVEDAYENGGEWCNYGWSDGQMALFPTQKGTYDKLQKIPGHENDCGRPGINGGYMANPHVKYGINCYGVKPPIDDDERFLMENSSPYPKTKRDEAREKEVEILKKSLGNVLVSPYNRDNWSRY